MDLELSRLLGRSDLSWQVRNGSIEITPCEVLHPDTTLKCYDARRITLSDSYFVHPEILLAGEDDDGNGAVADILEVGEKASKLLSDFELAELIRTCIEPASWHRAGRRAQCLDGLLIVRGTDRVHKLVEELLSDLHARLMGEMEPEPPDARDQSGPCAE